MTSPESREPEISAPVFVNAVSVLSKIVTLNGAKPVDAYTEQHRYGVFEDKDFAPDVIIGREAILQGSRDGVSHQLNILLLNEASQSGNYDNKWVAGIWIAASEGDDPEYTSSDTGGIQGLVVFTIDRKVWADLGHGTGKSEDPVIQNRLNEIVGAIGLDPSIFDEYSCDYNDEMIERLSENLIDFS